MAAEGALPHIFFLPPVKLPALAGMPATESQSLSYSLFCVGAIVLLAVASRLALAVSPRGAQNLLEWLVAPIEEQAEGILGRRAARYMPFFAAIFLFILTANLLGLVPGFMSPTADYHTNLSIALVVAGLSQYAGIREIGWRGYLHHFAPPPSPWWLKWSLLFWMWPLIHTLEQFIRPVSLTVRLFGNIYAKEMLLLLLSVVTVNFLTDPQAIVKGLSVVPFLMRPAIILLGTLVSIVQAAVFTILAMVYVALAAEGEEPHAAEGAAH